MESSVKPTRNGQIHRQTRMDFCNLQSTQGYKSLHTFCKKLKFSTNKVQKLFLLTQKLEENFEKVIKRHLTKVYRNIFEVWETWDYSQMVRGFPMLQEK